MGCYLNPSNENFAKILRNRSFVDKSLLIARLNEYVGTKRCCFCITRPRRFGKSTAAKMLTAYYSRSSDSHPLFSSLKVASSKGYRQHLNCYNTIVLNITDEISSADWSVRKMLSNLNTLLISELKTQYPDVDAYKTHRLDLIFDEIYSKTGIGFVFIIDEWDCILRERVDDRQGLEDYLAWLKLIFKDKAYVALAYMTGILPIKKYGTENELNMFREYTMIDPYIYAPFIGFTEDEVRALCDKFTLDFAKMQRWYDGYSFANEPHIYNPYSVVNALEELRFKNWWTKTETYESLRRYIAMNFDGLKDTIVRLIAGDNVEVDTSSFQNDMYSFASKDDVLSLLIHLGYLAQNLYQADCDDDKVSVHIPNYEIQRAFIDTLKDSSEYAGVHALIGQSKELLQHILSLDSNMVARAFDKAHEAHCSILKYNDENSLSCVVSLSLLLGTQDLYTVHRELPAGKGFADLVYLPKPFINKPALLIKLKYDVSAKAAIEQIKERRYTSFFKEYQGEVLLVGINYSRQSKHHQCIIEKWHSLSYTACPQ